MAYGTARTDLPGTRTTGIHGPCAADAALYCRGSWRCMRCRGGLPADLGSSEGFGSFTFADPCGAANPDALHSPYSSWHGDARSLGHAWRANRCIGGWGISPVLFRSNGLRADLGALVQSWTDRSNDAKAGRLALNVGSHNECQF